MYFTSRFRHARTNRRADTGQNPHDTRPPVQYDPRGETNKLLDTDLYHALPHPALAVLPTSADLILEVTRRVHAHFENGGIDDGTAAFLDPYLDKVAAQHHKEVERHFQAQLHWVQVAANQEHRNTEEAWRELETIAAALDEADADYTDARTQLLGQNTSTSWRYYNTPAPAPTAVPTPGNATATHTRPANAPAPAVPPAPSTGPATE